MAKVTQFKPKPVYTSVNIELTPEEAAQLLGIIRNTDSPRSDHFGLRFLKEGLESCVLPPPVWLTSTVEPVK